MLCAASQCYLYFNFGAIIQRAGELDILYFNNYKVITSRSLTHRPLDLRTVRLVGYNDTLRVLLLTDYSVMLKLFLYK